MDNSSGPYVSNRNNRDSMFAASNSHLNQAQSSNNPLPGQNIMMNDMIPQQNGYPQQNVYPQQNGYPQNQLAPGMFPMQAQPVYPQTVNPMAQQQINMTVHNSFGQFFFNAHDPNIAKTNVPVKVDSSMHIPIVLLTLVLIGAVVTAIILIPKPENFNTGLGIVIAGYLIYLIIAICCSDIRGYISNLKKFDDYKKTYDTMVAGRGYFHFWIECYHYRQVKTKNGTRQ